MSGEILRTRSTKSVTTLSPWTVAVGLFGLLKKMRPAPRALAIMSSTFSLNAESTLISATGNFILRAKPVQFSNVGAPATRPRAGEQNARTAFFRISCEPTARTTFSALTLFLAATASVRSPSFGELLNG